MLFKVASKAIALGAKVSLNHDPRCDETGKSNETTAFSPSQPFTGEPDLLIMVTRFKNSETRRFSHDVFVDRYVNCRNIPENKNPVHARKLLLVLSKNPSIYKNATMNKTIPCF